MNKKLPLSGKTVVLTRAQAQQSDSRNLFEKYGARVLDLPALLIGPPDNWGPFDQALNDLENFDWIIFSSSNGVEAFERRMKSNKLSIAKVSKSLKFAVVGRKTANTLKKLGIQPDFVPPDFVADSLIENFPVSGSGLRILLPRVQSGGRAILAESFVSKGSHVVEVSAYESLCPEQIPEKTLNSFKTCQVDAITFTSSKTVFHTFKLLTQYFGDDVNKISERVKLISIGPETSKSCKKYFKRLDKEANPHDINGLIDACIDGVN